MGWPKSWSAKAVFWSLAFSFGSARKKRPHRTRLLLVPLEDRCVPTTITPTTFTDGVWGSGSLRDAVLQFNADTGTDDDIIQLQDGTYALTIPNTSWHQSGGLDGDLYLTQTSHRWIIQGAGLSTVIDASGLQDRVFQIVNPGTQVVFQDLVIQGGLAQDDGTPGAGPGTTDALGGGILNNGGNVTLDDVVVQNNAARGGDAGSLGVAGHNANGGGIYSTGGALTLAGTTLANNQVMGGRGGDHNGDASGGDGGSAVGGGLYATGGSLDISLSTTGNNRATGGQGGDGSVTSSFGRTIVAGGNGGAGQGAGLYVNGGSLTIAAGAIATNQATGGARGLAGHNGRGQGGGLYNAGTLTVSSSTLSGNTAYFYEGGGIYNAGMLTVNTSTLSGNTAYTGGGILNEGTLTVSNSTLDSNFASQYGGGIENSAGTLTVSNSTLSGNSGSLRGGGIENFAGTMVSGSTLSGNSAVFGGGIDNGGMLTVTGSTLSGNHGSAILNLDRGTLTVTGSTLSGNTAGYGGGISNFGTLTISNSTLSGNLANDSFFGGGGIFIDGTTPVSLTNVTLPANRANTGGHSGRGGGLFVIYGGSPVLHNTLIGGNFNGATGTARDDVFGRLDPGGDYNLIGDGTDMTGLSHGVNGNQVGSADSPIDPLLGPLQNNGGPTLTHALLPGSPAIDAGNNAYATDWDQRGPGFPRVSGPHIDIGAFEFQQDGGGARAGGRDTSRNRGSVVAAYLSGGVLPRLAGPESFRLSGTITTPTSNPAESRVARSGVDRESPGRAAATPAQVVDRLFASRAARVQAGELADDLTLF